MAGVLLALLLWHVNAGAYQSAHPTALVPTDRPNYSFRDNVLEIRGNRGWLRTQQPLLNFRVAFEYQAVTPDAEPGVFVRTWVSAQKGGDWRAWGYRISLPTAAASDLSSLLVGHDRKSNVVTTGQLILRPPSDWQRVEITGEGSRVTIILNGAVAGAFELEEFGGYVMFSNRTGRAQLRNISIVSTEREPEVPADLMTMKQMKAPNVKSPKLVSEVRPHYTMDAMREKVQGVVTMEVVVLRDGTVGPVRVTRSLHRDLDLSAMAAVRAWRFEPATHNGETVAVMVEVELSFTLR